MVFKVFYSRKENCNLQVADELISFLFLDAQNPRKPHTKVWGGFWSLYSLNLFAHYLKTLDSFIFDKKRV
jgi:hypothetical protein